LARAVTALRPVLVLQGQSCQWIRSSVVVKCVMRSQRLAGHGVFVVAQAKK